MYKRILVLLDGSKLAEIAFAYATELSLRLALDVVLLHVYSPAEEEFLTIRENYLQRLSDIMHLRWKEVREKGDMKVESKTLIVQNELVMG
jgi:nucleotide-binding universal stress UspA family protein